MCRATANPNRGAETRVWATTGHRGGALVAWQLEFHMLAPRTRHTGGAPPARPVELAECGGGRRTAICLRCAVPTNIYIMNHVASGKGAAANSFLFSNEVHAAGRKRCSTLESSAPGQRHRPQQPRPARLELYAKHRGRAGRAEQCTEPKKQIDSKVLRQAIQRQQTGEVLPTHSAPERKLSNCEVRVWRAS